MVGRAIIIRLTKTVALALMMNSVIATASTIGCPVKPEIVPVNLTLPVTVQLSGNVTLAPVGSVLYKKEASITQFSGSHREITGHCLEQTSKSLSGRMTSRQSGFNTFETSLPGVGIRLTAIYDKAGKPHREWIIPFSTPISALSASGLTTDDIKLRVEVVKTGVIESGTLHFLLPSLLSLNDNSMVVNISLHVLTPKAHCMIQLLNPQITLQPINIDNLDNNRHKDGSAVNVNLHCINTQKVSITLEGLTEPENHSIFKNVATQNPAEGVGIEMLYKDNVIVPYKEMDILLPQQPDGFTLPLSARYAKSRKSISEGNVKAKITLHINYL